MKINIEYTEQEYMALVGLGTRIMDSVDNAVNKNTKISLARIKRNLQEAIANALQSEDYASYDLDDEEDEEGKILTPDFGVISGGKPTPPEVGPFASTEMMSDYALKGQAAFQELISLWMINFCVEGAEQPPRAEKCEQLTQSYEGRAMIHYMEYLRKKYKNGGLTYAIRDTKLVSNDQVRLVAENLTAVASACRFTQLASYLEHPNPSLQEDFFNV